MIEVMLEVCFFLSLICFCVLFNIFGLVQRRYSSNKEKLMKYTFLVSFLLIFAFGIPLKFISSTSISKPKESVYCRPLKLRKRVKKLCKDQIFMSLSGDLCNLKCKEN